MKKSVGTSTRALKIGKNPEIMLQSAKEERTNWNLDAGNKQKVINASMERHNQRRKRRPHKNDKNILMEQDEKFALPDKSFWSSWHFQLPVLASCYQSLVHSLSLLY